MESKLNKYLKNQFEDVKINNGEIHLFNENEFENAQHGYRFNPITNLKIDDWFGDDYYVIGTDTYLGDPIIINVNDNCVYFTIQDDWSKLYKIANSYEDFIKILENLRNIDINNNKDIEKFLNSIENIIPNDCWYWESIISKIDD